MKEETEDIMSEVQKILKEHGVYNIIDWLVKLDKRLKEVEEKIE